MFFVFLCVAIFILFLIILKAQKTNQKLRKTIFTQKQKDQERRLRNQAFIKQKTQEYKLELVKNNRIFASDLMGLQEFMIYRELIFCENIKKNFIVFPQISLKSFLKNEDENEVWRAYSSLVVDFLLVIKDFKNKTSKPFAVLEFNGGGHYGDRKDFTKVSKIQKNDAIKKEAIAKAGLLFFVLDAQEICKQGYIDEAKLKEKIQDLAQILKAKLL